MRGHMHKRLDMYDLESIEDLVGCHCFAIDLHDHRDVVRCPIYLTSNLAHLHLLYYAFAQYD